MARSSLKQVHEDILDDDDIRWTSHVLHSNGKNNPKIEIYGHVKG